MARFGANPSKLPQIAVTNGVKIMSNLHGSLWATAPIKRLSKEGRFCNMSNPLAAVSDRLNLLMISGSKGGKKLE